MMTDQPHEGALQGWHVDKRVPVALILALVIQAGGFGYWAATIDSRASHNAKRIDALEQERGAGNFEHRVTKLEVTLKGISATLNRIEGKLDNGRTYP